MKKKLLALILMTLMVLTAGGILAAQDTAGTVEMPVTIENPAPITENEAETTEGLEETKDVNDMGKSEETLITEVKEALSTEVNETLSTEAEETAAPESEIRTEAPIADIEELIETSPAKTLYKYETPRYTIISQHSDAHAQKLGARMESLFNLYNEWFHFKPEELAAPLTVRIYANKNSFDTYLERIIDSTRDDFVYLHYNRPERSELIGFIPGNETTADYDKSLAHQGFIQFLKAYVGNPPLWLREGFAVFFETAEWNNETEELTFPENLQWLPSLKKIVSKAGAEELLPMKKLLTMKHDDLAGNEEPFIPQAWALVSFLTNTENREYNRVLWDSVATLKQSNDLIDRSTEIAEDTFRWVNSSTLKEQYLAYIQSRNTFNELITKGILEYSNERYREAETAFQKALAMKDTFYIPYYYLGLIAYNNKQYEQAEYYYETAREWGSPSALVDYAMGVNAYAAERMDPAIVYLTRAAEADPKEYGEKSRDIKERIDLYY